MSARIEARRESTRQEIVGAAWVHAERVGIAEISLRELAADVGMRAPSLYTYFPSKDAIYDAMFAEGYRALDAHMANVVTRQAETPLHEAVALGLRAFVGFCQESQARYQLMFTRAIPGWEPSAEAYAVSLASYEKSTEQLAAIGFVGEDARDVYVAVAAGLAAQQMANDPNGDRWRRLAGPVANMLIDHFDSGREQP